MARDALEGELASKPECPCRLLNHGERGEATIGHALLKITLLLCHLIGDVSEADEGIVSGFRQCVERRCFHFYRQQPLLTSPCDHGLRFAEWRISRPSVSREEWLGCLIPFDQKMLTYVWVERAIIRWREIVITGAFIAQCALNQYNIGRLCYLEELPC